MKVLIMERSWVDGEDNQKKKNKRYINLKSRLPIKRLKR
jgi:hypothetical protein